MWSIVLLTPLVVWSTVLLTPLEVWSIALLSPLVVWSFVLLTFIQAISIVPVYILHKTTKGFPSKEGEIKKNKTT